MKAEAQAPDAASFARAMRSLLPSPPAAVAVAVSGGADSMALCLLAADWAKEHGVRLHALTIDHGLRAESATEAAQVQDWLSRRGIDHHILAWEGEKPAANLQAAARDARHRLLAEWCGARQVAHVLLAHHLDDQAETFLIRLGRGSGVDGLSAMQSASRREGITLLRPLLDTPKAALLALLHARNQPWLEDPGNRNPQFTRARIRALLPALEEAGISPRTLADTATRMTRARDYLELQTALALTDCLMVHEAGYLLLDYDRFHHLHDEIALRVLVRAVMMMSGAAYRPRFAELKALFDALESPRTLAGCKFEPAGDKLHILREPAAVAAPFALGAGRCEWDHRYRITVTGEPDGLRLGALGEEGRRHIRAAAPEHRFAALPATAVLCLPAVWHLETPVYVPHIGYVDSACTGLNPDAIRIDRLGHLGYV